MITRRTHRLLLLMTGLASIAWAASSHANWVVQVGAFTREPDPNFLTRAEALGPAYLQNRSDGTIAVNIGPWEDRDMAERQLVDIQNEFSDAFIKRYRGTGGAAISAAGPSAPSTAQSAGNDELLKSLSIEERVNVVLLDGRLHYKDGDTFIPLEEYLRNR